MALPPRPRTLLTDIEGTTGSISFVKRELFPYADARMEEYVRAHSADPAVRPLLEEAARLARVDKDDVAAVVTALQTWSAEDAKVPPLKALQGAIWRSGYENGALRGHVYADAVRVLRAFRGAGGRLHVFSSGSVQAQKLLFAHTAFGDLTNLFDEFFDLSVGSKRDRSSYARIAERIEESPSQVLYLSDVPAELLAAQAAGMQTVHVVRPEDRTQPDPRFRCIASFDELTIPD
ncbi:MAG: acireductone synthase [Candidatus Meridianibacter frigidus]|nr:MAG: acireductone synthase [Candidatus Eremiobacteraeota bacterium]